MDAFHVHKDVQLAMKVIYARCQESSSGVGDGSEGSPLNLNMLNYINLDKIILNELEFNQISMLDQVSVFLSVKAQFSTLSIFNSHFEKLNPFIQAPIFNLKLNSVIFQDSQFQFDQYQIQNLTASNIKKQGGIAYIQSINNHVIKSNFSNAQANIGAALYFELIELSKVNIQECQFINNTSLVQSTFESFGGAIYFDATQSKGYDIKINQTHFQMNFASYRGGALYLQAPYKYRGSFIIINSQFENNFSLQGGIVYISGQKVDNTKVVLQNINQQSYISYISKKMLIIQNMLAQNIQYNFTQTSLIQLNSVSYFELLESNLRVVYDGTQQIQNTELNQFIFQIDNQCSVCSKGNLLLDSQILNINSTNFMRNKALYGGALFIQNTQQNQFQQTSTSQSRLQNMKNSQQNNFQTPSYDQINILINDSVFQDNLSLKNGGGLFLKSYPILIAFTKFINNTAKQNGGAIYSDDDNNSLFKSYQSIYIQNQAQNGGGIYSYQGNSITSQQTNMFQQNLAYLLNNDVYTSPTQMIAKSDNKIYKNQDKKILFSINNHFSGVLNQEIVIQLVNDDEAIYTEFENIPLLHLSVIQGKAILSSSSLSQKNGIFNFTEQVSIQGYFGEKYLLKITSDSIKIPIGQTQAGHIIYQTNYQRLIEINMIERCNQGYIPRKNSQGYDLCIQCPQGTYSLDPTQSSCQQCPFVDANCYGNVIEIPLGYWRKSKNTAQIYPCFQNFQKCIGDNISLFESLAQFKKSESPVIQYCNRGYIGAICDDCDYNSQYWDTKFYKTSYNSCNQQISISNIF
ncbi:hypothetical protein ABPG74_008830 [Tetrahymena malaccensis]